MNCLPVFLCNTIRGKKGRFHNLNFQIAQLNLLQILKVGYNFKIPWGHHIQILTKCKGNRDKALYFVRQTMNNNWFRAVLMNFLDTNLYERDGKAITNFEKMLPGVGTDSANEITKDRIISIF